MFLIVIKSFNGYLGYLFIPFEKVTFMNLNRKVDNANYFFFSPYAAATIIIHPYMHFKMPN